MGRQKWLKLLLCEHEHTPSPKPLGWFLQWAPAPVLVLFREAERSRASLALLWGISSQYSRLWGGARCSGLALLLLSGLQLPVSFVLKTTVAVESCYFHKHLKADHVHKELWCQPSLSSILQQPAQICAGPTKPVPRKPAWNRWR